MRNLWVRSLILRILATNCAGLRTIRSFNAQRRRRSQELGDYTIGCGLRQNQYQHKKPLGGLCTVATINGGPLRAAEVTSGRLKKVSAHGWLNSTSRLERSWAWRAHLSIKIRQRASPSPVIRTRRRTAIRDTGDRPGD